MAAAGGTAEDDAERPVDGDKVDDGRDDGCLVRSPKSRKSGGGGIARVTAWCLLLGSCTAKLERRRGRSVDVGNALLTVSFGADVGQLS